MKKRIAVISPSAKPEKKRLSQNIKTLQRFYDITLTRPTDSAVSYFSANDSSRLAELQAAWDSTLYDFIWMSRGGHGITRILDDLNWKAFKKHPKGFIGFSDGTALHIALNNMGYSSVHAPMVAQLHQPELHSSLTALHSILEGNTITYRLPKCSYQKEGKVKAPIVGGNLTLIVASLGTETEIITKGKILFIEEVGEAAYRIDRLMVQLSRAGKLKGLKGVLIGSLTDCTNEKEFGSTALEIIWTYVKDLNVPVYSQFPAGHGVPNVPLILGRTGRFHVRNNGLEMEY
ncbi:MAG: LD-carboxypeptidase [Cytophagaceae bacterium]|jgi:muramoyltetrapeptide carboxypeptidase|nr:LD-carboxypeptidase [Cytophagaceae bacterium]